MSAPKGKKGGKGKHIDAALDALVAAIEGGGSAAKGKTEKAKEQQFEKAVEFARKAAAAMAEAAAASAAAPAAAAAAASAGGKRKQQQVQRMPTEEEQIAYYRYQEEQRRQAIANAQYVNKEVPLAPERTAWTLVAPNKYVRFAQFDKSEAQYKFMVELFTKHLTEPYSGFTHHFFMFGWPDLSVIAFGFEGAAAPAAEERGAPIGAVVSKVSRKGPAAPLRGYIAMLAVDDAFRGAHVGSSLVAATVELMKAKGVDEVSLETPVSNAKALQLYTNLGFAKTKFLTRYYLDGTDAIRLKLWLRDFLKDIERDFAARNAAMAVKIKGGSDADAIAAAQAAVLAVQSSVE